MRFLATLPGVLGASKDGRTSEYSLSAAFFWATGLPIPEIGDIAHFENCVLQICEFDSAKQVWRAIEIEEG